MSDRSKGYLCRADEPESDWRESTRIPFLWRLTRQRPKGSHTSARFLLGFDLGVSIGNRGYFLSHRSRKSRWRPSLTEYPLP
jgi:hypothetical protein